MVNASRYGPKNRMVVRSHSIASQASSLQVDSAITFDCGVDSVCPWILKCQNFHSAKVSSTLKDEYQFKFNLESYRTTISPIFILPK